jgi:FtsP/CotA-like multicopper oxidase with cupredoxin domain
MTHLLNRRSLLSGSATLIAAGGVSSMMPALQARAAAAPMTKLTIDRRTIEVMGKPASVFGIRQPDGTSGITLDPDARFRVDLANAAGEDVIIHWHGQKPPYVQDGFADANRPLIPNATTQSYDYAAVPGTHWMHSHHSAQEQALMAAPLVVRSREDLTADVQEVTVLLHDFSFRDPAEILAGLTGGGMDGMADMDHSTMEMGTAEKPAASDGMMMTMAADLNDVEYDAFLANDRTLDDPLVVRTERNGRVRLRLINGAASSGFWIDLGALNGTLVAVDGMPVMPVAGTRFPMSMAQRLDILVDVPAGAAFPVLAQVEGKQQRTGFILAAPNAQVAKISGLAGANAAPLDLSLEAKLRALRPVSSRPADVELKMALTGDMAAYVWSINNRVWPDADRPVIRQGQRVVIEMMNQTMMAHPMHLHGHNFQVTALNGNDLAGAVRDTVFVPSMGSVRIAFDADNPGRWPLHCHNLYHMLTGMMTEFVYDTFA